jgi:hypothetical protein
LAVVEVYASSSAWTVAFREHLAALGLGSAEYGFALTAADQLNELPWSNLDRFTVVFNRPAAVQQDDLSVRGVNVGTYAFAAFAYDDGARAATWTLDRPVRNDKLLLDLNGETPDGVYDSAAGSESLLDGEWAGAPDTFPSGDGTAGGDFRFRANVLPGDVNRTGGRVNALDVLQVRRRLGATIGSPDGAASPRGYSAFCDVNGNGAVTAADVALVRSRYQTALPAAEPSAAAPPTLLSGAASVTRDLFGTTPVLA